MQSVRISSPGDIADALMEALLSFGAASCSIEDSNLGAPQEQEIYSEGPIPWQSGKRQLWKDSTITALFAAGEDVSEALAMAANSVGLKEMPRYVVEVLEDCDWVLEVEVLSFRRCLFVLLCVCALTFASLLITKLVFTHDLYS